MKNPPGTEAPQRFRPKLRYELIGCGLNGHELLGTNAKQIRDKDHLFVRESEGLRWYRCLRCDSWLALSPPEAPTQDHPPEQGDVTLPLRGKALRDRYVLRVIAIDRAFHVLVLALLATVIFLFGAHQHGLQQFYTNLLNASQGVNGGIANNGELSKVHRLFSLTTRQVYEVGLVVVVYAALETAEMVGLWLAKRWAEYLTLVATIMFIPYEVYEIAHKPTALKIATFALNVGIAVYLLLAKRLFGLRGGGKAEQAAVARDTGWLAIKAATPKKSSRL